MGGTYIEHTLSLRNFMAEFGSDATWEELEQRLPGVLAAVNAEHMTSYKCDLMTDGYVRMPGACLQHSGGQARRNLLILHCSRERSTQ